MGSKGGQFRTIRSLDFGYGHKSGMGANSYGSAVPSDGEAHIGTVHTLLEDKSAEGEQKNGHRHRCKGAYGKERQKDGALFWYSVWASHRKLA